MNSKLDLILDKNMMNEVKSIHPHKYILLLSVTHLYNVNPNRDNRINIDEVIDIFNYIAERFFGETFLPKNAIEYPFFYLVNNKFWFLKIKKDKDEIYNDIIKNKNSRFTLKRIREVIEYAYLSEGMHHNFQNKNFRKKLAEKIKHVCMSIMEKSKEVTSSVPSPLSKQCANFISYLTTLQRIHGGNENALAEFQAQNPLFARVVAPHPLEDELVRDLKAGTHSIILTGHAGDGKTTLAFAVYRKLCGIPFEQPLPELGNSRVHFTIDGHKALLIKDLSEQEHHRHEELLKDLLDGQTRSLLVSNTGALREFFLSQEKDASRHVELESSLLGSLSREQDDSFSFRGRPFKIYNLALRDNLPLAQTVLSNMLKPELWTQCSACRHQSACPVHFNRMLLADTNSPARQRLFLAYKRLQAYGIRLTMRQLSEHLAYCLTGGLDEQSLCRAEILEPHIGSRQHVYNLFFGGPHARPDSLVGDMAAIRAVHEQRLGAYPLPCVDKKLWHALPTDAKMLGLPSQVVPFLQRLLRRGSTQADPSAGAEARLQARRLLYFCARPSGKDLQNRLQQEFLRSPGVVLYAGLHGQTQLETGVKRHLLTCLFHVLQEHFTGIHLPTSTRQHSLYITLNRPTPLLRQSVQIVLCSVSWQENFDLRLQNRPDGSPSLLLEGRRNLQGITPLELTVPFLDYVLRRYEGAIGDLPRATFAQQLDTLKAQILRCMKEDEGAQPIRLLRYCSDYKLIQDDYILNDTMLEVIRGTH
ncbi:hypothetical protein [uncultured Mailhella sp.]|uniref:hypothetical protein n=1 Tax=uncultured Mailhella sp. TaxID=1981031 RepID=UPI002616B321|nr:hypothetical protein [uncultured Mailhella sp.]